MDLTPLNSFGCPATAQKFFKLTQTDSAHLEQAVRWLAQYPQGLVFGGGSNFLLASASIPAVLLVALRHRGQIDASGTDHIVRAGAGESWHEMVQWTLAQGLFGLENLSLIPGTVGAAPVQNIGAYGVELSDLVDSVEAIDRSTGRTARLTPAECGFSYRDSEFKRHPDQWLITAVRFRLSSRATLALDYGELRNELAHLPAPTPIDVASAVIRIRRRKLPDPAVLGNAGSFFKNPIVSAATATNLLQNHPNLPTYSAPQGHRKLAAGWLIEQCGLKGFRRGNAGIHTEHALVLINHGGATGAELLALADHVVACVDQKFGVQLEPEPRIIRPV